MRHRLGACWWVAPLLVGATAAGCQTYEREVPGGSRKDTLVPVDTGPSRHEQREQALIELTEEHPDSPKAWYMLGEFYEKSRKLTQALSAFLRMQALIEDIERQTGRVFTGGHWELARVYYQLKEYAPAVEHLKAILSVQPGDPEKAALQPNYREAHRLLGTIYFEHRQWDLAQAHLGAYKDLGGNPMNVEAMLIRIENELRVGRSG